MTIGLTGAFFMSKALGSLLVQVTPRDPVTFAGISILLVLVAIAACVIPGAARLAGRSARRAENGVESLIPESLESLNRSAGFRSRDSRIQGFAITVIRDQTLS